MAGRIYLSVPFSQKGEAKALGARWDPERRLWYVTDPQSSALSLWPIPDAAWLLPGEDRSFGGNHHLFVDLIPRNCWFTNVRYAIAPADWERLRHQIYGRAEYRCEVCGGKGQLEAHERWDYNAGQQVQSLRRLIALCHDCHQATHFGLAQIRSVGHEAFDHLLKVNQWDCQTGHRHVEEAFALWQNRNQIAWELDLSMITAAGYQIQYSMKKRKRIAEKEIDRKKDT